MDAILINLKNSSNIGKVKDDAWAGMWVQEGRKHCGYFSAKQVQVPFFPELPLRPHTCLEAGIWQEKAPTWEHLDLVFTKEDPYDRWPHIHMQA